MNMAYGFSTGFADPVRQSQDCFRALMDAMARPGTKAIVEEPPEAPAPLTPSMAAVLLTLCDFETAITFSPSLQTPEVQEYAKFHTSAPLTSSACKASFVFLSHANELQTLGLLALGSIYYPDSSTTVVVDVGNFSGDLSVTLKGPGIEDQLEFSATGLDLSFWRLAQTNHHRYPLGLDFIFCGQGLIAALPRSTRIEV